MPKDEWNRPRAIPEGYAKQQERDDALNRSADKWISQHEEHCRKRRIRKKRQRRRRRKESEDCQAMKEKQPCTDATP